MNNHPFIRTEWYQGFNAGTKAQRKSDIEHLIKTLETLEVVKGIGPKTGDKIRNYFLKSFTISETKGAQVNETN